MKFLDGVGQGLMLSGVVFWVYVVAIGFSKHFNSMVSAIVLIVLEAIITAVGMALVIYGIVRR